MSGTHIAGGSGDPLLNASILWWNATTIPLSEHWWNPPYFYLTHDVTTFTENLLGISPIASPVFWLTGNPLTAYNLALFLTWPLSAFGVYLLVLFLTDRADASFLAGLSYGFTPYRMSEYGHIQMVSSYWLPFALLALHRYLAERRARWLVMFGAAWLLQSLANGYLMLFGAVFIGLWLAFFCSARQFWRAAPAIVLAWLLASLPLIPILLRYRTAHAFYALRRSLDVPLGFSVRLGTWLQVSSSTWLWSRFLPEAGDNHFPGVTAVAIVVIALFAWGLRRGRPRVQWTTSHPRLRTGLAIVTLVSAIAITIMYLRGPWSVTLAGVEVFHMTNYKRARILALVCGVAWVWLSFSRETLNRRSVFVFYSLATIAMGICAIGPVIQIGSRLIQPAPYWWLMYLPGFNELRVPMRFWMLGILCLSISAGLAVSKLPVGRRKLRAAVFVVTALGLLLDGWIKPMPMADAQILWPAVEPQATAFPAQPILELPLGPDWDSQATFRSISHRRPLVNGVSGYDPPHYLPLKEGLNGHDPAMLHALASYGSIDVVVNGDDDRDGAWVRYVSEVPGAVRISSDGTRTTYRLPNERVDEAPLGDVLPIAAIDTYAHDDARAAIDGRLDSEWRDIPQRPVQWVSVDLGAVHQVGAVTNAVGEYARDFPRVLAIDLSVDGSIWEQVWEGPVAAPAFRASVARPLETPIRFTFQARPARFVRLRQLANHVNYWRIAELRIYAPAPHSASEGR